MNSLEEKADSIISPLSHRLSICELSSTTVLANCVISWCSFLYSYTLAFSVIKIRTYHTLHAKFHSLSKYNLKLQILIYRRQSFRTPMKFWRIIILLYKHFEFVLMQLLQKRRRDLSIYLSTLNIQDLFRLSNSTCTN